MSDCTTINTETQRILMRSLSADLSSMLDTDAQALKKRKANATPPEGASLEKASRDMAGNKRPVANSTSVIRRRNGVSESSAGNCRVGKEKAVNKLTSLNSVQKTGKKTGSK